MRQHGTTYNQLTAVKLYCQNDITQHNNNFPHSHDLPSHLQTNVVKRHRWSRPNQYWRRRTNNIAHGSRRFKPPSSQSLLDIIIASNTVDVITASCTAVNTNVQYTKIKLLRFRDFKESLPAEGTETHPRIPAQWHNASGTYHHNAMNHNTYRKKDEYAYFYQPSLIETDISDCFGFLDEPLCTKTPGRYNVANWYHPSSMYTAHSFWCLKVMI